MKLFLIGSRPNVFQRWQEILKEQEPRILNTAELTHSNMPEGSVLIVHLSSISSKAYEDILSYKAENPAVLYVFASDIPTEEEGIKVLQAGANGYINTYITGSLFFEVLTAVKRGDIWAGPELLQKLLRRLLNNTPFSTKDVAADKLNNTFKSLSAREHEVLSVLVTGVSNKEIARSLEITERTVKAHLSSIFQKTGVADRVSLILMAKNHS